MVRFRIINCEIQGINILPCCQNEFISIKILKIVVRMKNFENNSEAPLFFHSLIFQFFNYTAIRRFFFALILGLLKTQWEQLSSSRSHSSKVNFFTFEVRLRLFGWLYRLDPPAFAFILCFNNLWL